MNTLFAAIITKLTGTAFWTTIGGRMYAEFAPPGAEFPYCVFFVVASTPEDTFKDKINDTAVQFSLYSDSGSVSEITSMYSQLTAAMDDASLSVSGDTLIWCMRQRLATMVEEIEADGGVTLIRHWAVDYSIKVQD